MKLAVTPSCDHGQTPVNAKRVYRLVQTIRKSDYCESTTVFLAAPNVSIEPGQGERIGETNVGARDLQDAQECQVGHLAEEMNTRQIQ